MLLISIRSVSAVAVELTGLASSFTIYILQSCHLIEFRQVHSSVLSLLQSLYIFSSYGLGRGSPFQNRDKYHLYSICSSQVRQTINNHYLCILMGWAWLPTGYISVVTVTGVVQAISISDPCNT